MVQLAATLYHTYVCHSEWGGQCLCQADRRRGVPEYHLIRPSALFIPVRMVRVIASIHLICRMKLTTKSDKPSSLVFRLVKWHSV